MAWGKMFRLVVCFVICWTGTPEETKLLLYFSIAEPKHSHIPCFGLLFTYIVCDDAECSCVVSLHWRGWLFMAHLFQSDAHWYGLSCINVESTHLSFSG